MESNISTTGGTQFFWLLNAANSLALTDDTPSPNFSPIAYNDMQLWGFEEQEPNRIKIKNKRSGKIIVVVRSDGRVVMGTDTDEAPNNHLWTIGNDFQIVSGAPAVAIFAPTNTMVATRPAEMLPIKESQWIIKPLKFPPPKWSYNEFNNFATNDRFCIHCDNHTGKTLTVRPDIRYSSPPFFKVTVEPFTGSANQIWHYEPGGRLVSGSGYALVYYAGRKMPFTIYATQGSAPSNTWLKTGNYIWAYDNFANPDLRGEALITMEGDDVGLRVYDPLATGQQWSVQPYYPMALVGSPEITLSSLPVREFTVTINVKTSSDYFSGTSETGHVQLFFQGGLINFDPIGSPNRGSVTSSSRKASFRSPQDISGLLVYRSNNSLFSDDWKIESIEIIINEGNVHQLIGLNTWIEKHTLAMPGVSREWLNTDGAPVDVTMCTFFVPFKAWIDDKRNWRTYTRAELTNAGMLIGMMNGTLFGETLTFPPQSTRLQPGWYSYVYTEHNEAIIYWFHGTEKRTEDYVRHSQIGQGDDITVAGEFKVVNRGMAEITDMVLEEINNESGHYRPFSSCLYYVNKKLEELGVEVENIKWWSPN